MSWQRCLSLRPPHFILLRSRNSSQLPAPASRILVRFFFSQFLLDFSQHWLFLPQFLLRFWLLYFAPLWRRLPRPPFLFLGDIPAPSLPAWRVCWPFSVPVLLPGFIPSGFLLPANPCVILSLGKVSSRAWGVPAGWTNLSHSLWMHFALEMFHRITGYSELETTHKKSPSPTLK